MNLDKLKHVQDLWKKDSVIDEEEIATEILKIPSLHRKYLDLITEVKNLVFRKNRKFLELKGLRAKYYNGQLSRDELTKYNWQAYQGKTPLKSELDRLLEVDTELLQAEEELFEMKAIFEYLEEVLGSLKFRANSLKTVVDWKKFLAGD